jgi:hypothetical protein
MFWTENPPNYKLEHLIPTSLLNRTENPLGPREAVLLSGFDDVADGIVCTVATWVWLGLNDPIGPY